MIKATLILLLAAGVSRLLRKRSAAERHLLWVAALAAASLLPLLTLIVPAWRPAVAGRIAAAFPGFSSVPPSQRSGSTGGTVVHAVGIEHGDRIEILLYAVWIGGSIVAF